MTTFSYGSSTCTSKVSGTDVNEAQRDKALADLYWLHDWLTVKDRRRSVAKPMNLWSSCTTRSHTADCSAFSYKKCISSICSQHSCRLSSHTPHEFWSEPRLHQAGVNLARPRMISTMIAFPRKAFVGAYHKLFLLTISSQQSLLQYPASPAGSTDLLHTPWSG